MKSMLIKPQDEINVEYDSEEEERNYEGEGMDPNQEIRTKSESEYESNQ
jgi:hypothetical protein